MNLAFLLHLYQPPVQEGRTIKGLVESCYAPLFKTIKNKPGLKLTVNLPLSLTHQLHSLGYQDLLKMVRELYEAERIELTSTAAYHPLLTKLPRIPAQNEIMLNEYGLGYYFGKDKGFEGEEAIMLKNVVGFFPPEMAVSMEVLDLAGSMGYDWMIADESALPLGTEDRGLHCLYEVSGYKTKVVVRNRHLSNLIAFKRDTQIDEIIEEIINLGREDRDIVISLDGETFGHHFDEGIFLFGSLAETLTLNHIHLMTVSELVDENKPKVLQSVLESSWGADDAHMAEGNIYPLWDIEGNVLQRLFWELYEGAVSSYSYDMDNRSISAPGSSLETLSIWDPSELEKVGDLNLKNELFKQVLLLQCFHSDQFWWSSGKEISGQTLFNEAYLLKALELYNKYFLIIGNSDLLAKVKEIENIIRSRSVNT